MTKDYQEHTLESSDGSTVVLLRCDGYDQKRVDETVARGISMLSGAARFAAQGEHILLKPNLLVAKPPERAVTTHPAVFRAAARAFRDTGAELHYGDSTGFGRIETVARRSGIAAVAEELGIPRRTHCFISRRAHHQAICHCGRSARSRRHHFFVQTQNTRPDQIYRRNKKHVRLRSRHVEGRISRQAE